MLSVSDPSTLQKSPEKGKYSFQEHPWVTLFSLTFLFLIMLSVGSNLGLGRLTFVFATFVVYFVLVPFFFHVPKGKTGYMQYLRDIRIANVRPMGRLLLLVITSWGILALCQGLGTIIYRASLGYSVSFNWIRLNVFNLSPDLQSNSVLASLPSGLEEVGWRGLFLVLFMQHYSEKKSIAITAIGFGLIHLLNLDMGREAVWVWAQVAWAACLGIFYAYLTLKTDSLWPAMLVHWLGNSFAYSLTWYVQVNAPLETWLVYNFVFSFGLLPTALLILWVRYFTGRWMREKKVSD
jgi:membrane protease YdiL (CAAX protease family)